MFRGDRRAFFAIAGCVIALLIWLLAADLSSVDHAYESAATDASNHYVEHANYEIANNCAASAGQDQVSCADKARNAAREQQREEQDLAAQKITAWWTKIMGTAALIGMAISIVGVGLVYTTFTATRDANAIAREAMIADGRAWLKLSPQMNTVCFSRDIIEADVEIKVKNIGKSVATDVICWGRLQYERRDAELFRLSKQQTPDPSFFHDRDGMVLWPDEDHPVDRNVTHVTPDACGISRNSFRLFLIVIAEYKTIYDSRVSPKRISEAIYEVKLGRGILSAENFPAAPNHSFIENVHLELGPLLKWRVT